MPNKIWIDLDNTPHVPFFAPIIRELENRGYETLITARDAFQVRELAERQKLVIKTFGRHAGKNVLKKIANLLWRSFLLAPYALKHRPALALSHGARSQLQTANFLKIPTVEFIDYEHVATPPLCNPKWEIVPEHYDLSKCRSNKFRIRKYPGIKEDVYAASLLTENNLLDELEVPHGNIIAVVRPPADEAHYHNADADILFEIIISHIKERERTTTIMLPRNKAQANKISGKYKSEISNRKILIPETALDGMNLIYQADLVIGGGGTMTREVAAAGTPSYSFFRG